MERGNLKNRTTKIEESLKKRSAEPEDPHPFAACSAVDTLASLFFIKQNKKNINPTILFFFSSQQLRKLCTYWRVHRCIYKLAYLYKKLIAASKLRQRFY